MGPRLWVVFGCVCALVALTHSAAVGSTTETLVVARTDAEAEATSAPIEGSTDAAPTKAEEGPTTEEPSAPIKLTEMDVKSKVTMRYAHTAIVTKVRNPAKKAQEATFRVLLPETAFISGFTMILDGKSYKAYVKEKEEAKQIYTDAVSQGLGAAHIATKARDSNHFTVSVNVEPNTLATFNLTYEELLVRRNNVYNHAINLHPGALVPKLTVTVHIQESEKITQLRVPEVRTGNEIDATEDDAQNSLAKIERCHDDREAIITFTPDLDEQMRLMDVYAEKSKESQSNSRSFGWYGATEAPAKVEGVLGQFVVQYDVHRSTGGEILVNNGYFVHFYTPVGLPPLPKHVVFVLDTSGSMMDRKIVQLREAMQTILGELNPGDYFTIVEFASYVKVYDLKEADEPPRKTSSNYFWHEERPLVLVPPFPATAENIAKAKTIVSRLSANGGTNIYDALNTAIAIAQKGVGGTQPAITEASNTTASNEAPAAERSAAETPHTDTDNTQGSDKNVDTRVETTTKRTEDKKLEPMIIFLTDGDPTVGETDPVRIINRITEKNYGVNRASLFSLAFGEDADRKFLRKLSLRNEGFMRHIYEAADAALQLRDFYRHVASPLLADVTFTYPAEQIKEGSLTKNKFRTLYAGSETVVAGRVADAGVELTPHVYGICGVDDSFIRKKYEVFPRVPTGRNSTGYLPLERLWAYLTVQQLLDQRDADAPAQAPPTTLAPPTHEATPTADNDKGDDKENTPEKKALKIALQYEFVTPLTSLVVVKPNDTKAVNAESVHKQDSSSPLALNSGVGSAHAASFVGGLPGSGAPPLFAFSPLRRKEADFSSAIGHVAQHQILAEVALDPLPQYEESELDSVDYADGHVAQQQILGGVALDALPQYEESELDSVDYADGLRAFSSRRRQQPARSHSYMMPFHTRTTQPQFLPPTSGSPAPNTTPAQTSALAVYHLEDFSWIKDLLKPDSDFIELQITNDTVRLELNKDADAPKESGGDAACARATDGDAGVCVYLSRCEAARNITAQDYTRLYCQVNNRFAGVCCPLVKVDLQKA